jgi:hypothetical protein
MTRQKREENLLDEKRQKRNTFQLSRMVTVPDKLGTKTNKFFHQRLDSNRGEKDNVGKKFDSKKNLRGTLILSIGGVAE